MLIQPCKYEYQCLSLKLSLCYLCAYVVQHPQQYFVKLFISAMTEKRESVQREALKLWRTRKDPVL